MNQPVRVGLVFPRSGQQVFVQVPSSQAQTVEARRFDHALPSAQAAAHGGTVGTRLSQDTTRA